jgi:pSer/pThr/pTyr-binding forkhead associated (FHA) protein
MQMQVITLPNLLDSMFQVDKDAFIEKWPGIFILAVGILSGELRKTDKSNATSTLTIGTQLKHDLTQEHPLAGYAFFLQSDDSSTSVTLGRSFKCNITVPDNSVSENHCRIFITEDGVAVMDLDSKNGTFINMTKIPPGQSELLADEDILTLGRYSFQVMVAGTLYSALSLLQSMNDEEP